MWLPDDLRGVPKEGQKVGKGPTYQDWVGFRSHWSHWRRWSAAPWTSEMSAGVSQAGTGCWQQKASLWATGELHRTLWKELVPERTGSPWVPMQAGGLRKLLQEGSLQGPDFPVERVMGKRLLGHHLLSQLRLQGHQGTTCTGPKWQEDLQDRGPYRYTTDHCPSIALYWENLLCSLQSTDA